MTFFSAVIFIKFYGYEHVERRKQKLYLLSYDAADYMRNLLDVLLSFFLFIAFCLKVYQPLFPSKSLGLATSYLTLRLALL